MEESECVWIMEVWDDGERIEQIVHATLNGVAEEVEVYDDGVDIEVMQKKVWMGEEPYLYINNEYVNE